MIIFFDIIHKILTASRIIFLIFEKKRCSFTIESMKRFINITTETNHSCLIDFVNQIFSTVIDVKKKRWNEKSWKNDDLTSTEFARTSFFTKNKISRTT